MQIQSKPCCMVVTVVVKRTLLGIFAGFSAKESFVEEVEGGGLSRSAAVYEKGCTRSTLGGLCNEHRGEFGARWVG